jgi:hypothetical protein
MPASTALLTDSATMIAAGPSATTAANAASGTLSGGGGPLDYVGMLQLYRDKLKELKALLTELKTVTDSGDSNLTTINNALLTLS